MNKLITALVALIIPALSWAQLTIPDEYIRTNIEKSEYYTQMESFAETDGTYTFRYNIYSPYKAANDEGKVFGGVDSLTLVKSTATNNLCFRVSVTEASNTVKSCIQVKPMQTETSRDENGNIVTRTIPAEIECKEKIQYVDNNAEQLPGFFKIIKDEVTKTYQPIYSENCINLEK